MPIHFSSYLSRLRCGIDGHLQILALQYDAIYDPQQRYFTDFTDHFDQNHLLEPHSAPTLRDAASHPYDRHRQTAEPPSQALTNPDLERRIHGY